MIAHFVADGALRPPQVLASMLRICTQPTIYRQPSTVAETLAFCEALLEPVHRLPVDFH